MCLFFFQQSYFSRDLLYLDEDKLVSKNLLNLWTDFAKTGTQPCDSNCWTPFTKDNQKRLKISTKGLEMISIDQELQDFWLENVWPKLIGNFTYKKLSDEHDQMYISNKDEL